MKKFHFPLGVLLFLVATATCAAQADGMHLQLAQPIVQQLK